MNTHNARPRPDAGFMLLEVLVALLVFSLGVLGLVGLQSAAVRQSGLAKYRADASLLANELIGNMWVGNRTFASLQTNYSSANAGPNFQTWSGKVGTQLPGAATYPPVVTLAQIDPLAVLDPSLPVPSPSSRVTVTVRWKMPGEPTTDQPHSLTIVTQIK